MTVWIPPFIGKNGFFSQKNFLSVSIYLVVARFYNNIFVTRLAVKESLYRPGFGPGWPWLEKFFNTQGFLLILGKIHIFLFNYLLCTSYLILQVVSLFPICYFWEWKVGHNSSFFLHLGYPRMKHYEITE